GRVGGLFDKIGNGIVRVYVEDSVAAGLVHRDADGADRGVGLLFHVEVEQHIVIHLVNVVARQDQDVVGVVACDKVQVLPDGIGGALVPIGIAAALVRLQNLDAACKAAIQVPGLAAPDMIVEAMRSVLGEDDDVENIGIHAIT